MLKVVAGSARGITLTDVNLESTRPITSRIKTSLFDKIAPFMFNEIVFDLYAGTGGMGIEALSRGASFCHFVEWNEHCAKVIDENLNKTSLNKIGKVHQIKVIDFLKQNTHKARIILYDPPFPIVENQYEHIQTEIIEMKKNLSEDGAIVFRHPKGLFQSVDGFEVQLQDVYGISEITYLINTEG